MKDSDPREDETSKPDESREPETHSYDETESPEPDRDTTKDAKPGKLKAAWRWVRAKRSRTIVAAVAVVLVVAGVVLGFTNLKYPLAGIFWRTTLDVTVTDSSTNQPVPGAAVEFGGAGSTTDKSGRASLTMVKPGRASLRVRKSGYSDAAQQALAPIRRGSPVAVSLRPNGIKVVTTVTNLITGGSVQGAEVKSGEASAITNQAGRAELSLPANSAGAKVTLSVTRDGFNQSDFSAGVKSGAAPVAIKLTPEGKVYFQSNRTGRIDIYGSNLDGSGAEVVLAGTGSEDEATGILPNTRDPHTLAIVSSRDGRRAGGLHHDLFLFNTESNKLTKIEQDVEFTNYRAWIGGTLIYSKSVNIPSFGYCNTIKSYDLNSGKTTALIEGDGFNNGCPTVALALSNGFIYSVRGATDDARNGIFLAKLSGAPKRISGTPSDTTVRRARQTLLSEYYNYNPATGSSSLWDSIDLGSFAVTRLPNGPSIETSRYYNDSPGGDHSEFIEERDGKSELYLTDGNGGNEKKLTSLGSVNQFVQWYGDDYIVFSSTKTDENALYVIGAAGGTPVKVSDFYRGNARTYGGGGNPYN